MKFSFFLYPLLLVFLLTSCQPTQPFEEGLTRRLLLSGVSWQQPEFLAISGDRLYQGQSNQALSELGYRFHLDYELDRPIPVTALYPLDARYFLLHFGEWDETYRIDRQSQEASRLQSFPTALAYRAHSGFENDPPVFLSQQSRLYLQTDALEPGSSRFGSNFPSTGQWLYLMRSGDWKGNQADWFYQRELSLCAIDSNGQFIQRLGESTYDWWEPSQDVNQLSYQNAVLASNGRIINDPSFPEMPQLEAIWAHDGIFFGIDAQRLYEVQHENGIIRTDLKDLIDLAPLAERKFRFDFRQQVIILDENGKGFNYNYPSHQGAPLQINQGISAARLTSFYAYLLNSDRNRIDRMDPAGNVKTGYSSPDWEEISAFQVTKAGMLLMAGRKTGESQYQVAWVDPSGQESILPGTLANPITQLLIF